MQPSPIDAWVIATQRAARVAADADGAEAGGQRIIDQQLSRQAFTNSDDLLHHFQRLQGAHDAGGGAENSGLRAGRRGAGWRWFGKEAAIARVLARVRLVRRQLPVEFGYCRRDQSLLREIACVVDEKA